MQNLNILINLFHLPFLMVVPVINTMDLNMYYFLLLIFYEHDKVNHP